MKGVKVKVKEGGWMHQIPMHQNNDDTPKGSF
jgi:hypothetical protein